MTVSHRELPRRECPACRAIDPEVIFEQRFATAGTASLIDGYDVAVCKRCGCGYADRVPEQAAFDAYYRDLSKYDHAENDGRESRGSLERFADVAALIGKFAPRDALVAEIGCATGGLLARLRMLGVERVYGVDPSPYAAAAATRLYDVPAQAGTLSEDLRLPEPAGMVIVVGVLEHIRELDAALPRIRAALRPGGRIYVEVPDATRFAEFLDAPFQQYSVEHIVFFSPASLDAIMARHGFRQRHLEQVTRPESSTSTMPVVAAVYELGDAPGAQRKDGATLAALREYTARSKAMDEGIQRVIDSIVGSREPIVVWGVGTHTARLLETSRLAQAEIRAFVDSNPKYQGKTLVGRPILPPDALRSRAEPVLISSRVFQREIADQIRTALGCNNRLLLLYPS